MEKYLFLPFHRARHLKWLLDTRDNIFEKWREDRERGQIKNKMYNLCKHSRSQEKGFSESGMASAWDLLLLPPMAPPEPPAKENLKLIKPAKKRRITWKTWRMESLSWDLYFSHTTQWGQSFSKQTSVAVVVVFWLKWAGYLAVAGLNLLAQLSDRKPLWCVKLCVGSHSKCGSLLKLVSYTKKAYPY